MSKFSIKIAKSYKLVLLFSDNFSKVNSKFCENGKVYHLVLTRNLSVRLEDLCRKLLKEENLCNKYKHLHTSC